MNTQPSGGVNPRHLTVDRSGKCVLVANYSSGSVAVLPLVEDGTLAPVSSLIQHEGSSMNKQHQLGPHAHSVNGGVGYSTGVSEYDQAILTLDFLTPADEKMIWRGVGDRSAYEGSNPAKATKIVNEAVARILKKFPPKT